MIVVGPGLQIEIRPPANRAHLQALRRHQSHAARRQPRPGLARVERGAAGRDVYRTHVCAERPAMSARFPSVPASHVHVLRSPNNARVKPGHPRYPSYAQVRIDL